MYMLCIHGKNPSGRCNPHFSVAWPLQEDLGQMRDNLWWLQDDLLHCKMIFGRCEMISCRCKMISCRCKMSSGLSEVCVFL